MFLNKIDLFAEKLPHSPLGDYFPDYTGGDDYDRALAEWALQRSGLGLSTSDLSTTERAHLLARAAACG